MRFIMRKTFFLLITVIACQNNITHPAQYSSHDVRTMADNFGEHITIAQHTGIKKNEINSGFAIIRDDLKKELPEEQFSLFKKHFTDFMVRKLPSKDHIIQEALKDANLVKNKKQNRDHLLKERMAIYSEREFEFFSSQFNYAIDTRK